LLPHEEVKSKKAKVKSGQINPHPKVKKLGVEVNQESQEKENI
jgi:hypothetical protein